MTTWEYNGTNLKLRQNFPNHDFYELDNIYLEFLNKNPKYRQDSNEVKNKFIRAVDSQEFMQKVNQYFSSFNDINKLMQLKPCVFNFTIIDYKYITEETCQTRNLSEERKLDIKKQLVYEYSLQLNYSGCETFSEFWIPHFFEDDSQDYEMLTDLNNLFIQSNIMVYKRNFLKLQELFNNA